MATHIIASYVINWRISIHRRRVICSNVGYEVRLTHGIKRPLISLPAPPSLRAEGCRRRGLCHVTRYKETGVHSVMASYLRTFKLRSLRNLRSS